MKILGDPIKRIISIAETAEKTNQRKIIALAGYPGSGKTTLARSWQRKAEILLEPGTFIVVGMDGFHMTKNQLSRLPDPRTAFARRGAPYTFDPEGLIEKLKILRSSLRQCNVGWPGFEHEIGDPVKDAQIIPANCNVILLEGIYTLLRVEKWSGLEDCIDEAWFLDTDIETSMERLYLRHQQAWNLSPEDARKRADGNDRLNCEFISPCRERADFIIIP